MQFLFRSGWYVRLIFLLGCCALPLQAQTISDLSVTYSQMKITEAHFDSEIRYPVFYRHFLETVIGLGDATIGLTYQSAQKSDQTAAGVAEEGFMLTGGYNWYPVDRLRVEAYARLGIFSDTDPGQPLYAADTDIQFNLVGYLPDGVGFMLGNSFFPSAYIGTAVNRYGRVQMLAGSGIWWNGIGTYATGLYTLNGVADPFNPGSDAAVRFAKLKNSGLTLSMSYQFHNFKFLLKKNRPIRNSGNDLSFSIQYQFFFNDKEAW